MASTSTTRRWARGCFREWKPSSKIFSEKKDGNSFTEWLDLLNESDPQKFNIIENEVKNEDFDIRFAAVKALMSISENGEERLNSLSKNGDGTLEVIINHVLDKRI